jgi:glycerol transport system ATP-binding protein
VVQIGTPVDLFEKPQHTFVGHFIGSPGMNVLPCRIDNGSAYVGDLKIATANRAQASLAPLSLATAVSRALLTGAASGAPCRSGSSVVRP